MLSVIMLSVIMLSVIMLSVIVPNVIMLSAVAPFLKQLLGKVNATCIKVPQHSTEWHSSECNQNGMLLFTYHLA
jgi:hypothetical protein